MGNSPSNAHHSHSSSSKRRHSSNHRRSSAGNSAGNILEAGVAETVKQLEEQDLHPAAAFLDSVCGGGYLEEDVSRKDKKKDRRKGSKRGSSYSDEEEDDEDEEYSRRTNSEEEETTVTSYPHRRRGGGGREEDTTTLGEDSYVTYEESTVNTNPKQQRSSSSNRKSSSSRRNRRGKDDDASSYDDDDITTDDDDTNTQSKTTLTTLDNQNIDNDNDDHHDHHHAAAAATATAAAAIPTQLKQPLASSFAKRCYFTKSGIGSHTQHYEGLTLTGNIILMLAAAMKLKGCPTICDEDLRRVEQTYPNQFSRLPDELLLSSGWRRISKYCHFSNKPIPDGIPFFHSKQRLHPSGGYYFLLAAAVGMVRPMDVEPLNRDTLVLLETDYPTQCDAAPSVLIQDPDTWTLVDKFCFFSGGPINTDEDVYYQADFDGNPIYMLAFLSPSLSAIELYKLDDNNDNTEPVLTTVAAVEEVESVYDLTERDFDDLKLYHLGPCRALPQYILQPQAWTKVLPPHFLEARETALMRCRDLEMSSPQEHNNYEYFDGGYPPEQSFDQQQQQQAPPPPSSNDQYVDPHTYAGPSYSASQQQFVGGVQPSLSEQQYGQPSMQDPYPPSQGQLHQQQHHHHHHHHNNNEAPPAQQSPDRPERFVDAAYNNNHHQQQPPHHFSHHHQHHQQQDYHYGPPPPPPPDMHNSNNYMDTSVPMDEAMSRAPAPDPSTIANGGIDPPEDEPPSLRKFESSEAEGSGGSHYNQSTASPYMDRQQYSEQGGYYPHHPQQNDLDYGPEEYPSEERYQDEMVSQEEFHPHHHHHHHQEPEDVGVDDEYYDPTHEVAAHASEERFVPEQPHFDRSFDGYPQSPRRENMSDEGDDELVEEEEDMAEARMSETDFTDPTVSEGEFIVPESDARLQSPQSNVGSEYSQSSAMRGAQELLRRNRQRRLELAKQARQRKSYDQENEPAAVAAAPVDVGFSPTSQQHSALTWETGSEYTGSEFTGGSSSAWTDKDVSSPDRSSRRALILQMARARMKNHKQQQQPTSVADHHHHEDEKKLEYHRDSSVADLDLTGNLD